MIDFRRAIMFCKELDKVENFEEAVHDMKNTWVCHHRFGTKCPVYKPSIEDLKTFGLYYNRPPEEFIFLTRSEHSKIHNNYGNDRFGFHSGFIPWNKGKNLPDEEKAKIAKTLTGKKQSEETKRKISESLKGHITSEETKKKQRDSNLGKKHNISDEAKKRMCYGNAKGTKWYNNGVINKRCFECPNGFKEGRI